MKRATVMMELLPPVGWGDVATKQDLDSAVVLLKKDLDYAVERLETRLETKTAAMATREDLHALEHKFSEFQTKVLERMNAHLLALIGVNTTLLGIAVGVLTLLR